jgi:hypothetical protein
MASKKEKLEQLENEIIDLAVKNNERDYDKFFNEIANITGDVVEEGLKYDRKALIKKLLSINIPATAYLRQTYNMTILSGIQIITEGTRLPSKEANMIEPLKVLVRRYPIEKPKLLAKKIDMFAIAYINKTGAKGLGIDDVETAQYVNKYFNNHRDFIKDELAKNKENIKTIHTQVKNNTSKAVIKDLRKNINARKEEVIIGKDGKDKVVKRPLSREEIRSNLVEKYGKDQEYRVNRIVNTELHDLAQNTGYSQHLLYGFTHKTWNTQRDSRVRDGKQKGNRANHVAMHGKTVPIDKDFNVIGGGNGAYPGDPSLPPSQRINCRCYLTYEKRET